MKNTSLIAVLAIVMLGCGSPPQQNSVPPPPQGWTMPGAWTLNMTASDGNSMTMSATVQAVDCSDYSFAPATGAPICYGATANYEQFAVTSVVGDLFAQPLVLQIGSGFETDGSPIPAGQSVPMSAVFSEANRLGVGEVLFDLTGTALDGAISGTWQCDTTTWSRCGGIVGTFTASKAKP